MIVLDTHVLVWWIGEQEKLSPKALQRIEAERKKKEILVSSISIWEIALLVKKGRLTLTMDVETWIGKIEQLPFVRFLPVDNAIAVKSVNLPEPIHDDPADRLIIATALSEGAVLLTADKRIRQYSHVRSLW